MRKFKQFVALLVCIATVASLLTFSITASAEETLPGITITEGDLLLIEKLEALGVITNDYIASDYVTRRQMAEIIRTYMGLPASSSGSGKAQFGDVASDDPSYGAICSLYDMGIVTGDNNGNFHPDDYLNYNEAVVFIINAVGHKDFAVREGGFPTGYMRIAIKHDMLDNLYMTKGTSYVPVIDVYKMLEAALDAASIIPEYKGDGSVQYTISDTDTFLSDTYGVYKYRGQVTGNEFTSLTSAGREITDEQIEIERVIYDTPGYVYGYFLGYTVDYYVKHSAGETDELLYVEETPKQNSTFRIDSEDISDDEGKVTFDRIYYTNDEDKEEYIDLDAVDVIYNNQNYKGIVKLADVMPANGYVEALDNDGDNVYEVLFIYNYTVAIVDSIDAYAEEIVYTTGDKLELSDNVRSYSVISVEHQTSVPFDSIKKGDVLNIAEGRGTEKVITIYVNTAKVTGKITGYQSDLGYEIKGEYYEETAEYSKDKDNAKLEVGLEGTFYLDMNGKIAAYKYSAEGDTASYAAMAGIDYNEKSTMNRDVKVKLFTSLGEFATLHLADNVKIDGKPYDMTDIDAADEAIEALSNGELNGKYAVYDSYIIRYTLSSDGKISFIDTGKVGGAGYLNPFADGYKFSAEREGVVLLAETEPDKYYNDKYVYAGVSPNVLVFTTPKAGELNDEMGYSVSGSWKGYHSYAVEGGVHASLSGKNATIMDNFTAYHTGASDTLTIEAFIVRGASTAQAVGDDTALCVITEITDSVDKDGEKTKTLYENDVTVGQLAQEITVTKLGETTEKPYSIEEFTKAKILQPGTVIRCGTDADGKINNISVVSDYVYDSDKEEYNIVPAFGDTTADKITNHALPLGSSEANLIVADIDTYDSKNNMLEFSTSHTASSCDGVHDFACSMKWLESVKIYDSQTGKLRTALASEIRDGDKCVLRLKIYTRVYDVIIFR